MGTKIENLPAEEAERQTLGAAQSAIGTASGIRGADQNFEADAAELQKLQDEEQIGHDASRQKS